MSDISSIKVPEVETPYAVKDAGAVHLSGSNVAAADFMLNLQNNAGGAIKWPSGDMTDLKRGWTAADGFTGAGVGADIPSIAAMIDAKMNTAAPVDAVTDGDMHAVTSNAVFDVAVLHGHPAGTQLAVTGIVAQCVLTTYLTLGQLVFLAYEAAFNGTGDFELDSTSGYPGARVDHPFMQWGQWTSYAADAETGVFYNLGARATRLYYYGTRNKTHSSLTMFVIGYNDVD